MANVYLMEASLMSFLTWPQNMPSRLFLFNQQAHYFTGQKTSIVETSGHLSIRGIDHQICFVS
jgi:hypothetical protein